ncbi:MAG TPA: hypothetical protein PLN21_05035 [Gemmatales bacterium]|nr:hypothetical protein [Gemmatales bacterium]
MSAMYERDSSRAAWYFSSGVDSLNSAFKAVIESLPSATTDDPPPAEGTGAEFVGVLLEQPEKLIPKTLKKTQQWK